MVKYFIYVSILLISLVSCSTYRPAAHVIINNESKEIVPLELVIKDKEEGTVKASINHQVRPGIQQIPVKKLKRGVYSLHLNTHKGNVSAEHFLSLDTDRWVMVTYTQSDSLSIQKKYGHVDTRRLKKINGQYTGIDLYIENRKPPTL